MAEVAAELKAIEADMADAEKMDDMDEIIHRYGEGQARFEGSVSLWKQTMADDARNGALQPLKNIFYSL